MLARWETTPVEELVAGGTFVVFRAAGSATVGLFGGSPAAELRVGALAPGPEEPQAVTSAAARSSATTFIAAAHLRVRDPPELSSTLSAILDDDPHRPEQPVARAAHAPTELERATHVGDRLGREALSGQHVWDSRRIGRK